MYRKFWLFLALIFAIPSIAIPLWANYSMQSPDMEAPFVVGWMGFCGCFPLSLLCLVIGSFVGPERYRPHPTRCSVKVMEDFERIKRLAADLPGVEEAVSYGTPSLKVKGKFMLRLRETGILVIRCEIDEKPFLMHSAPEIYFETDHYKGWPGLLIRLENIDDEELKERLKRTWRLLAPKKLLDQAVQSSE